MNSRPYISLWLMLASALAIFFALALADDITLGSLKLRKAPFRSTLLKAPEIARSAQEPPAVHSDAVQLPDTAAQTFLILGDSMTRLLSRRLADYVAQNGHRAVYAINWDSSTSESWAESNRIETHIEKFRPTFIFVCLGSNESYIKDAEIHRPNVEKMVAKFGKIPFVWIGPPNLGREVTYNDMLRSVVGDRRLFVSYGLKLERGADHAHPTEAASAEWMDTVMRWLPQSAHPFRAAKPAPGVKGEIADYVWFPPPYAPDAKQKNEPKALPEPVSADSIAT